MQLAYDANGNLITDQEGRTLVYDAWNRLVEVKNGSTTLSAHTYDGLGRRIETDGYKLFHSAQWQVIEERNGSNQTTTQYVWSPVYVDAMVLRDKDNNADGDVTDAGERHYITHDANFNITALTDSSGTVVERYEYDPYGQRTVLDANWSGDADHTSDFAFEHGHQGLQYHAETGLYEADHRWYSPSLGRWTQQDPLGYVDGISLYEGLRSSPENHLDPAGLASMPQTLEAELWLLEQRKDEDYRKNGDKPGPESALLWEQIQLIKQLIAERDALMRALKQPASPGSSMWPSVRQPSGPMSFLDKRKARLEQLLEKQALRKTITVSEKIELDHLLRLEAADWSSGRALVQVTHDFTKEVMIARYGPAAAGMGRGSGPGAIGRPGGPAPVRGGAKTPVSQGAGRAAKQGTPNSIYEQVDGAGNVRSRTFYDENGRSFSRQDFDHRHGGVQPHEHLRDFDSQGRPISKETVRQVPSGYDNSPSN